MHSTIQHQLHRAPTATRRARWQPYTASTHYPITPGTSTPSPQQPVHKDNQKHKYVAGLVAQAVKSLTEIWQDVPVVFPPSSVPQIHDAREETTNKSNNNNKEFSPSNTQLPSPESPSTRPRPHVQASYVIPVEQPLKTFVHEVLRRSRTSGAVLQTALCYMEAVRSKMPTLLAEESMRRDGAQQYKAEESRIITLEEWERQEHAEAPVLLQQHQDHAQTVRFAQRFFGGPVYTDPNIPYERYTLQVPNADDSTPKRDGDAIDAQDSSRPQDSKSSFSDYNIQNERSVSFQQADGLSRSQTQGQDSSKTCDNAWYLATASHPRDPPESSQPGPMSKQHQQFFGEAIDTFVPQTDTTLRPTVVRDMSADATSRTTSTITPVSGPAATAAAHKYKVPSAPLPELPSAPSPLLCPRRAFLAVLILASKFQQDRCYSNRAWAKMSGLPAREIGRCERSLGDTLQWRLWVGKVTPRPSAVINKMDPSIPLIPLPQGNGREITRTKSEGAVVFGGAPARATVAAAPRFHPYEATRAAPNPTGTRDSTRTKGLRRCATLPSPEYFVQRNADSISTSSSSTLVDEREPHPQFRTKLASGTVLLETLPFTPPMSRSPGGSSTTSYSPSTAGGYSPTSTLANNSYADLSVSDGGKHHVVLPGIESFDQYPQKPYVHIHVGSESFVGSGVHENWRVSNSSELLY